MPSRYFPNRSSSAICINILHWTGLMLMLTSSLQLFFLSTANAPSGSIAAALHIPPESQLLLTIGAVILLLLKTDPLFGRLQQLLFYANLPDASAAPAQLWNAAGDWPHSKVHRPKSRLLGVLLLFLGLVYLLLGLGLCLLYAFSAIYIVPTLMSFAGMDLPIWEIPLSRLLLWAVPFLLGSLVLSLIARLLAYLWCLPITILVGRFNLAHRSAFLPLSAFSHPQAGSWLASEIVDGVIMGVKLYIGWHIVVLAHNNGIGQGFVVCFIAMVVGVLFCAIAIEFRDRFATAMPALHGHTAFDGRSGIESQGFLTARFGEKVRRLEDIPLDDLKREQIALETKQRKLDRDVQRLEENEGRLKGEYASADARSEKRRIAREIQNLGRRLQAIEAQSSICDKELRTISGVYLIKEMINDRTSFASTLTQMDLAEVESFVVKANADGDLHRERVAELAQRIDAGSGDLQGMLADSSLDELMENLDRQCATGQADAGPRR